MKTRLLVLLLSACVLPACSVNPITGNPVDAPALTDGKPQIPNACLVDAIVCYNDLKNTGANPAILRIYYTKDGTKFGHAMVLYTWKPDPDPYARDYLFDRTNASTSLPPQIDNKNPLAVARFAIPSAYSAEWDTP